MKQVQKKGERRKSAISNNNNLYRLFSNNFGINYKNTSHPLFQNSRWLCR
nr:MAG TPA: hypothetical protein [Caudoviricetes sp.]